MLKLRFPGIGNAVCGDRFKLRVGIFKLNAICAFASAR